MKLSNLHQGNALIGVLVSMVLGLGVLTLAGQTLSTTSDTQINRATADYARVISKGAENYISNNYDTVLANATATKPAVITVAMLKSSNNLPASVSNQNPYGQTYTVYAIEPQANKLQTMLVSSGGQTIKTKQLLQITNMLGGQGGYIASETPSVVSGAYGAWSMPLSSYSLSNNGGHLATALFFVDGQVSNDYLYRSSVTGHPELNRMNTDLDMAKNDVNNVGTMNSATTNTTGESYTGGWYRTTGDGGVFFQKYGGGWRMTDTSTIRTYGGKSVFSEVDVSAGRNIAAAGNVSASGSVTGGYIKSNGNLDAAGSANISGNANVSGTVTGGAVTSNGRLTTGEFLQLNKVATVGSACSSNGLVGRDSTGAILSCQSGAWTKPESGKSGYYCRRTSFDKGRSDDYVGYTPRTDDDCPVIYPGQAPSGYCSCIKVMLDY